MRRKLTEVIARSLVLMFTLGLAASAGAATPLAVWNGDFPTENETLNGVSIYPKNGASSADGVITVSSASGSSGPALATSSVYKKVAVVFKADFSDVTLADGQILVAFGNSNIVTYNSQSKEANAYFGMRVKSDDNGGFYAAAIYKGTEAGESTYTTGDNVANTFTLTGEKTMLATYSNDGGTFLYVLENGQAKALFSASGLKESGASVSRIGIGGAYGSISGKSRMGGLKIKAVAVYADNSSLPFTSSDLATYEFPQKQIVASDESVLISSLNAAAPVWALVNSGATVNVDATPSADVGFAGAFSIADNVITASGVTVNLKAGGAARVPYTGVATTFASVEDGAMLYLTGANYKPLAAEDDTGSLAVALPAGTNADQLNVTIVRNDGGYVTGTWNGDGAYTYNNAIDTSICGSGTALDFTYTNTTTRAYSAAGDVSVRCDFAIKYNNAFDDKTTGLFASACPWTTGGTLGSYINLNSAQITLVVAATMPSTSNTQFLHFGRSTESNPGILFSTGTVKNQVIISYNTGKVVTPITTMSVPNAAKSRHVYAITKDDTVEAGKSTFTVYLDGVKWKRLAVDTLTFANNSGVQVGSDFGGEIQRNASDKEKYRTISAAGDTSAIVNFVRLFGRVLDESTIAKFSVDEEYPYVSPYGNSVRTFTADGNWKETEATPWSDTPNGGVASASGSPLGGSSLTVTTDNASGVTVSVNLDADTTYEALTLTGDPIAFEFAEGKTGVIKATGAITIGAETTIKAGALQVGGATTILDNGTAKLIFDYSDYDASGVTVANPQTTPLVLASMDKQEEGLVTCTVPKTPHRTYSFGYDNGGYNLTITAKQATLTRAGATIDVDTLASALNERAGSGDTVGINEDVMVADLDLTKDLTLDLGANTLTVTGTISGSGALVLSGTGTLVVPVGTTFANLTSTGSAKISVTGTVTGQTVDAEGNITNGSTLFTITNGTYSNAVVGSDYGDIHYTIDGTAYKAGKVFYVVAQTSSFVENPSNWAAASGGTPLTEATDYPTKYDTAVFDSDTVNSSLAFGGSYDSAEKVATFKDLLFNVVVKTEFSFNAYGNKNSGVNFGTSAWQPTMVVVEGATAKFSVHHYNANSNSGYKANIYYTVKGKGDLEFDTAGNGSHIYIKGDFSEFAGHGKVSMGYTASNPRFAVIRLDSETALDLANSTWDVFSDGKCPKRDDTHSGYTFFNLSNKTYQFGSLNTFFEADKGNHNNVIFEIGKEIDEDSAIFGKWYSSSPVYGGTVKWLAPTATFTQAITNAYNVTLAGGGNVYVEADATEGGVATTYIPTQLAFTDNGGYLTIDGNNSSIAENILAAISDTTAGVGLNVETTEALSAAAPTALLSGVSFSKKGAGTLTLTGAFTSLGTVTVAKGAGALVTPKVENYTLGETTGVVVGENTLTFSYAEAKIGDTYYADVETALGVLANGGDRTVIVQVIDNEWNADSYLFASTLSAMGIVWNVGARTYSFAAAYLNTTNPASNFKATVAEAVAAASDKDTIYLFKNVKENVVLPGGVSLAVGNYTLDGTVTTVDGYAVVKLNGTYTSKSLATPETWKGTADNNWSNAANWSERFVPTAATPVTFPTEGAPEGGWVVYVGQDSDRCASMTVAGNVTLTKDANQSNWSGIGVAGDVTGNGMLTLWRSGINSYYESETTTISCPLVIKTNDSDSFLQKKHFDVTGTVEVNSLFVVYDETEFKHKVTLKNGAIVRSNGTDWYGDKSGTAALTFSGGIEVAENASASFEANGQTVTGEVVLDAGSTFTLSAGTSAAAATFTLGAGSTLLVPNGATVTEAKILPADASHYVVVPCDGGYTVADANYEITIPEVVGATANVTVNDVAETPVNGKINVAYGAKVVVTYTANEDYAISGNTVTIENVDASNKTISTVGVSCWVTAETWTGAGDGKTWKNASNWNHGVVPNNGISVTFLAGNYEITVSNVDWDPWDGRDKCGAMTVDGNVTLKNEGGNDNCRLAVFGNITGNGSLTLSKVGLDNGTWDPATTLQIACKLYVAGNVGNSWFFNRDIGFAVSDAELWGNLDSWSPSSYTSLSIKDDVTVLIGTSWTDGDNVFHQKGVSVQNISVAAGKQATFTYSGQTTATDFTLTGKVTLGVGSSVTVPESVTLDVNNDFVVPENYKVTKTGSTYATELDVVTFTLPEVAGATATVTGATDNGDGSYTANVGATVTITWAAANNFYFVSGTTSQELTVEPGMTVSRPAGLVVNSAAAEVGNTTKVDAEYEWTYTPYETAAEAFAAVDLNTADDVSFDSYASGEIWLYQSTNVGLEMTKAGQSLLIVFVKGDKYADVEYTGHITAATGLKILCKDVTEGYTDYEHAKKVIWYYSEIDPEQAAVKVVDENGVTVAGFTKLGSALSLYLKGKDGYKIILQDDVEVEFPNNGWNAQADNITIDLNGHTVSTTGYAIYATGGRTITIDDSSTDQTGKIASTAQNSSVVVASSGKVVIAGGEIEASGANSAVEASGTGSVEITGGTITGSLSATGETATIAVSGGTFSEAVPEDYCAEDFIPEYDAEAGTYGVKSGSYVAQVGANKYETLVEAVAQTQTGTIMLLKSCSGAGIFVAKNLGKNITIDLGGYTYTCSGPAVGSTGTATQAFHLEKGNTITLTNGKVDCTSESGVKMLVQNYSDLTLDGMTLDGTNLPGSNRYVLSNNNGNVVIDDTTITAKSGDFAFDVCRYSSYKSVNVTVTGNSVIHGNVEISASEGDAKDGFSLTLDGGTMTGDIVVDNSAKAAMEAAPEKATVTKAADFEQDAPEGYKWEETEAGDYKLVEDVPEGIEVEVSTTETIVAVPAECTAATLINTANRAVGDQLKVYNKNTQSYYSWQLATSGDNLVWDPLNVIVATSGGTSSTTSPAAGDVNLTAGQAVWVTRVNPSKPIVLNGEYPATASVAVSVEKGWNLVAPPPKEGVASYSINAVVSATAAEDGDRIVVPTAGVPYNLTVKDGKWGYYKIIKTYSETKKRDVTTTEWVEEVTVPSGTGFWYINGGDSTKNISL